MGCQKVVCFKFKNGVTSEEIKRHMDDFCKLKDDIPQITSYYAGKTLTGDDGAMPEYDSMHYLIFRNHEDSEIYNHHEAHQNFVKRNNSLWDKVFVALSEIND